MSALSAPVLYRRLVCTPTHRNARAPTSSLSREGSSTSYYTPRVMMSGSLPRGHAQAAPATSSLQALSVRTCLVYQRRGSSTSGNRTYSFYHGRLFREGNCTARNVCQGFHATKDRRGRSADCAARALSAALPPNTGCYKPNSAPSSRTLHPDCSRSSWPCAMIHRWLTRHLTCRLATREHIK